MPKKPEVEQDAMNEEFRPRRIRRRLTLRPETIAIVEQISRKTHLSPDEVVQVALFLASEADETTVTDAADQVIRRRSHLMAESVGTAFK